MKAEEIRQIACGKPNQQKWEDPSFDSADNTLKCLREIAAQLAELNENLKQLKTVTVRQESASIADLYS